MDKLRRTMLFIPGNNPGMLQNAGVFGADSIILDLEDAVSIEEKDAARILVRNALKHIDFYDTEVVIRINPFTSEFVQEDINVVARMKPDALMVTKANEEAVKEACSFLSKIEYEEGFEAGNIKIFPLIETAYGLENVYNIIKASTRVVGVLLGAEDLTADFGINRTKTGEEILYARNKIASACRACGVDAVDTPFVDLDDKEAFIKDIKKARALGMTGKAAINPRQVDTIHEIFAPSTQEIKYAQKVIAAMEEAKKEGKGVFSLEGKMIDAPIIARAETVINKARLSGLI